MLVYLDTNIWVYAYENDPTFGPAARQFMQSLRSGKHRLAGSLFVLNELLVLPTRRNDTFTMPPTGNSSPRPTLNSCPTHSRQRKFTF